MFHHMPYTPHTPIPEDMFELDDARRPDNVLGFMRIVPGESTEFIPIPRQQETVSAVARVCVNAQLETAVQ